MFCSECGKKIEGNHEFCETCQILMDSNSEENSNEKMKPTETKMEELKIKKDSPKPSSKKIAVISVAAVSVFIIMALGFFGFKYIENDKSEKALQKAALNEMQQVLDESNIDLEEFIISEREMASYKQLQEDLKEAISNKDTTNRQTYIEEVEEYKLVFTNASKEAISEKLGLLETMDTGAAFVFETEAIEQYREDISKLVLEGKYASALEIANEWEGFGKSLLPTKDYQMLVSQVDTRDYPKVKLFLQIKDLVTGETISINKFEKFLITEEVNGNFIKKNILSASQLNQAEKLNINLTADISGSMQYDLDHVKNVMKDFLGYMQFNTGDRASLITFDDNISVDVNFTTEKNKLMNAVDRMTLGNMTALYDALYVSVSKTAMEEGAKCVIAFTDGQDNSSIRTANDVIELAKQYKIPVFIIGIGQNLDVGILENITNMTGGYYKNVSSGVSMQEIYNMIYREQKELYMLEYETDKNIEDAVMRNTYVTYLDEAISMRNTISFTPSLLNEKPKGFEELLGRSSIDNSQIEAEILRIRAIWDTDRKAMAANEYLLTNLASGAVAYSKQGDVKMIEVAKNIGGYDHKRIHNFSNGKLVFSYIENKDAHRLYFKNDVLFRWRYAADADKRANASNYDNMGDSPEYKQWEGFALDEGYRLYDEALRSVH